MVYQCHSNTKQFLDLVTTRPPTLTLSTLALRRRVFMVHQACPHDHRHPPLPEFKNRSLWSSPRWPDHPDRLVPHACQNHKTQLKKALERIVCMEHNGRRAVESDEKNEMQFERHDGS
ncbi:hypothetical protein L2E82_11078 [Cichorium intybus]|uniref:Uncharacterized protein n=1 Tax=Cichorium intybus TaxID=13427 RepID=A0ACB9GC38_CICIN|nr:hypothetical protein L2E82_11078 [Cichorium intybus]